jgi:hypothetical protein
MAGCLCSILALWWPGGEGLPLGAFIRYLVGDVLKGDLLQGIKYLNISQIYIRHDYAMIMECLMRALFQMESSQTSMFMAIRITGTPGVGKSCFLPFVKNELVKLGKRVFVSMRESCAYFEGDRCEENADKSMLLAYPDGKERIIHLCDPLLTNAGPTSALTILFVSPDRDKYKGFSSELLLDIFMPPWREDEMLQCCKMCYEMDERAIKESYNKWGGSIRKVTAPPLWQDRYEDVLTAFLGSKDLLDKLNLVEKSHLAYDDRSKSDQWILHRWPRIEDEGKANYCKCVFDFPSQYIKTKISEALSEHSIDWKVSSGPQLLGKLYENEVLLHLFERISDPSVDYLKKKARAHDRNKTLVDIPVIRQHVIYSNQSIIKHVVCGALYIPIERNKTAIDFVSPPWIFQTTLNKSRDCKSLQETFDQFPGVKKWNFCMVIPSCAERKLRYPSIAENVSKFTLVFDADTL